MLSPWILGLQVSYVHKDIPLTSLLCFDPAELSDGTLRRTA